MGWGGVRVGVGGQLVFGESLVDSPHRLGVMRKAFPCHDMQVKCPWNIWTEFHNAKPHENTTKHGLWGSYLGYAIPNTFTTVTSRYRHDVSNHRHIDCLFNRLCRLITKNAENVSISWRLHALCWRGPPRAHHSTYSRASCNSAAQCVSSLIRKSYGLLAELGRSIVSLLCLFPVHVAPVTDGVTPSSSKTSLPFQYKNSLSSIGLRLPFIYVSSGIVDKIIE